jgi:hypothetical protein
MPPCLAMMRRLRWMDSCVDMHVAWLTRPVCGIGTKQQKESGALQHMDRNAACITRSTKAQKMHKPIA